MKCRAAIMAGRVALCMLGVGRHAEARAEAAAVAQQRVTIERVTAAGLPLERGEDLVVPATRGWRLEFWMSPADCTPAGADGSTCWYRMDPFDSEWSRVPTHVVQYTNLAPGSYVFRVRRCGEPYDCGPETAVRIRSRPYRWQTWWFRSLGVVFAGMATLAILGGAALVCLGRARASSAAGISSK